MESQPLVSVLITTYNREKYIAAAIESVLASTYTNFEIIITDDGSKDKTVAIAKSYADKDARVHVHINEHNLGDYPNRNKAASHAKGKYIKYVDGDDLIYPWGLELLVKMIEAYPEAGWGLCSLEQDEARIFPFLLQGEDIFKYAYFGPGLFHKAPLSSIINKQAFDAVGGFSGKQHLGDYELWHLLAMKFPVVLMPHGIVWHRVHDDQQSNDNRTDPEVFFKYTVSAANFFKDCKTLPIDEDTRIAIYDKLKRQMTRRVLGNIKRGKFSVAYKLYKATKKEAYTFSFDAVKD